MSRLLLIGLGFAQIAEGLVVVLTLGYHRTGWPLAVAMHIARRRCRAELEKAK